MSDSNRDPQAQQPGETDAHYVARQINECSQKNNYGFVVTLTPCKTFTSTYEEEGELIPPGFLVSIQQKKRFTQQELPAREVAAKLRNAIMEFNKEDQWQPNILLPKRPGQEVESERIYKSHDQEYVIVGELGRKKTLLDSSNITITSKGVWIGPETVKNIRNAPEIWRSGRGRPPTVFEALAYELAPAPQRDKGRH